MNKHTCKSEQDTHCCCGGCQFQSCPCCGHTIRVKPYTQPYYPFNPGPIWISPNITWGSDTTGGVVKFGELTVNDCVAPLTVGNDVAPLTVGSAGVVDLGWFSN